MSKTLALATPTLFCLILLAPRSAAPQPPSVERRPLQFQVTSPAERLEMIVNTSRILATERNIPRLLVENPAILRANPISPNQVQISAVKAGFTNLTLWDDAGKEHSIDVLVFGDARELENLLMTEFPDATLRVRPLAGSVVISGYVPRADMVHSIILMAQDYYPNVINNITVGGVQQVLLHVKLMEVSRTKLRRLGFDWAYFNGNDGVVQDVAGLIASYAVAPGAQQVVGTGNETLAFGIINNGQSFFGFLDALRQHNLAKVLAEPTLVTVSGRPASFSVGGEFPILVPQSLGTVSIEYRQFGTRVDFVPIVLGNGRVRLEVRPQVSEVDPSRSVSIAGTTVPGLRTRWVDTGVEMNAGQTLALAGLLQNQVEAQNRGLPWVSDLPWVGAAFRRVEEQNNEVELLILVTPEFVDGLDPHEAPRCGPGQTTTSPPDVDFYWRGYLEVPPCCPDGSGNNCRHEFGPAGGEPLPAPGGLESPTPGASSYGGVSASVRDNRARSPQAAYGPQRAVQSSMRSEPPRLIGPVGYDALP